MATYKLAEGIRKGVRFQGSGVSWQRRCWRQEVTRH